MSLVIVLPSISVPDAFISKGSKLIDDLDNYFNKFINNESTILEHDTLNVLCLDDDQNIHDLLKISFKNHNIVYREALNSNSFFTQYSEDKPDIVILDLILESESGVDAIKKVKDCFTDVVDAKRILREL